jgi:hypothetical protein
VEKQAHGEVAGERRPTLDELERKYGVGDPPPDPPEPSLDEARAMARGDSTELMHLARRGRGDAKARPAVPVVYMFDQPFTEFGKRLAWYIRQDWPEESRSAYFDELIHDLATANVALVQRMNEDDPMVFWVVDLDVWAPRSTGFRLGKLWLSPDPQGEWRARSRWHRFRHWLKGR